MYKGENYEIYEKIDTRKDFKSGRIRSDGKNRILSLCGPKLVYLSELRDYKE